MYILWRARWIIPIRVKFRCDILVWISPFHLFKIKYGLGPQYLRNGPSQTPIHIVLAVVSLIFMFRNLFQIVPRRLRTKLPSRLKSIDSLPAFKRELRNFFFLHMDDHLSIYERTSLATESGFHLSSFIYFAILLLLNFSTGPCWKQVYGL